LRGVLRVLAFGSLVVVSAIFSGQAAENDTAATELAARFAVSPNFRSASISPSGKYLAYVGQFEGNDNVLIYPLDGSAPPSRVPIADSQAIGVLWRDDERLIATIRTLQKFVPQSRFLSANIERFVLSPTAAKPPLRLRKNLENSFVSHAPNTIIDLDPNGKNTSYAMALGYFKQMFVGSYRPDFITYDLLQVNLDTGGYRVEEKGGEYTARWIMDGKGGIVARVDVASTSEDAIFVPDQGSFRRLATIKADEARVVGLTEDGESLAVLGRRDGDRLALYRLGLKDGQFGAALFTNPNGDIKQPIVDERTRRVIGAEYDDGTLRVMYFSPERQKLQRDIEGVLPGRTVSILSSTLDRTKHLVSTSGPQSPPVLQFVDMKAGRIDVVSEAFPQLRGTRFGEVRRHEYTTRDGIKLAGLLTLPPGKEPKGLPLVVLYGDLLGTTIGNFDLVPHYLAQRGYAVFQPGARNLKRIGDVASMDELGAWVTATQEDVAGGVVDVISKGIADPKRICIAGSGDDGYLALTGMVFLPDHYACAISVSGFSDIRVMLRDARDVGWLAINTFNSSFIRNRRDYADGDLVRFSPALHAESVKGPIQLIVGDLDYSIDQATIMRNALAEKGKMVELVEIDNEAGYFTRPENRATVLNSIDRFLTAHIGN
jgi:dipeptidyl aminopeptidase/acylaminoacyl peptidase